MHKQLKRISIGIVGALVIFGAYSASAWTADSVQRGWVDSIVWHTGFVVGPTPQVQINGWACMNPIFNQAANPTNVQVFQGNRQLTIVSASVVNRPDVVGAGACANVNNGFSLGLIGAVVGGPNIFTVNFLGGSFPIILEGQTVATIINNG